MWHDICCAFYQYGLGNISHMLWNNTSLVKHGIFPQKCLDYREFGKIWNFFPKCLDYLKLFLISLTIAALQNHYTCLATATYPKLSICTSYLPSIIIPYSNMLELTQMFLNKAIMSLQKETYSYRLKIKVEYKTLLNYIKFKS